MMRSWLVQHVRGGSVLRNRNGNGKEYLTENSPLSNHCPHAPRSLAPRYILQDLHHIKFISKETSGEIS